MLPLKELKKQVSASMSSIQKSWRRNKKIEPFLMAWPSRPIKADDGEVIDAPCILELPEDSSNWSNLMVQAINRTEAYALLLVEQRDKDVQAILETAEGSECWRFPIARSGDADRLGSPRISSNTERLGLLWNPEGAEA